MRTYVVTGSASGIGAATKDILLAQGARVVGVDIHDADIIADLGNEEDRSTLPRRLLDLGVQVVDGVLPAAGLSARSAPAERVLAVNYFGAVGTVLHLKQLLSASPAPRVCMISSIGLLAHPDDDLIARCLDGDESGAFAILAEGEAWSYERSKRAVSTWVRRHGVAADWLEHGILINAIAPGLIATKMAQGIADSPETLQRLFESYPHPLGVGRAADVAALAAFMLSVQNAYMAGQTIFLDGGHEAICGSATLPLRPSLPTNTSARIADHG